MIQLARLNGHAQPPTSRTTSDGLSSASSFCTFGSNTALSSLFAESVAAWEIPRDRNDGRLLPARNGRHATFTSAPSAPLAECGCELGWHGARPWNRCIDRS